MSAAIGHSSHMTAENSRAAVFDGMQNPEMSIRSSSCQAGRRTAFRDHERSRPLREGGRLLTARGREAGRGVRASSGLNDVLEMPLRDLQINDGGSHVGMSQ